MNEEETRGIVIDRISTLADEIKEILNSMSTSDETKDYDLQISSAIENTEYIKENISYTPRTLLKSYESEMRTIKDSLKRKNSNTDSDKILYRLNRIKNNLVLFKDSVENSALLNERSYERGFINKSEELAKRFDETRVRKRNARRWYLFFSIIFTMILAGTYIFFFYLQYQNKNIIYTNHLMLIAVCSPVIFMTVWLYWQVGRYARLEDLYTHKANLAYTLKTSVNYSLSIEDNTEKECTLSILKNLLNKLYESPIRDDVSKSAIIKGIGETSKMLREIKEIVNSK